MDRINSEGHNIYVDHFSMARTASIALGSGRYAVDSFFAVHLKDLFIGDDNNSLCTNWEVIYSPTCGISFRNTEHNLEMNFCANTENQELYKKILSFFDHEPSEIKTLHLPFQQIAFTKLSPRKLALYEILGDFYNETSPEMLFLAIKAFNISIAELEKSHKGISVLPTLKEKLKGIFPQRKMSDIYSYLLSSEPEKEIEKKVPEQIKIAADIVSEPAILANMNEMWLHSDKCGLKIMQNDGNITQISISNARYVVYLLYFLGNKKALISMCNTAQNSRVLR